MTVHTMTMGKYRGAGRHIKGNQFLYWIRAELHDGRVLGPWRTIPAIVGLPVVMRVNKVDIIAMVYAQNDLPPGDICPTE